MQFHNRTAHKKTAKPTDERFMASMLPPLASDRQSYKPNRQRIRTVPRARTNARRQQIESLKNTRKLSMPTPLQTRGSDGRTPHERTPQNICNIRNDALDLGIFYRKSLLKFVSAIKLFLINITKSGLGPGRGSNPPTPLTPRYAIAQSN